MLSEGWRHCRLGDLFESRRERGRPGLPLLSVTMNDGLVDREDLDRKQDSDLAPEEHLLVKPGDIAYNMMRMWQGAYGLAKREGIVSPAYVVLKPKQGVDSAYVRHLLRTPRMQYLLWAYSYGITDDRLRLYFQDFAKIPARVHTSSQQAQIASVLSVCEERVAIQRAALNNAITRRSGLLNRLLKPSSGLSRSAWTEFEFGDLVTRVRSTFVPGKCSESSWCIELENIEPGVGQLVGHSTTTAESSTKLQFQPGDVIFGKLRPYLRKFWVADRAGVCSSEFWVLRPASDACTPAFLACLLQSEAFMRAAAASAGSKMPRAEWDFVSSTAVSIPPLSYQLEVCRAIALVDQHLRRTREYIALLQRESEALLGHLFSVQGCPTRNTA
jgi:type I restriction enzyme S subunit